MLNRFKKYFDQFIENQQLKSQEIFFILILCTLLIAGMITRFIRYHYNPLIIKPVVEIEMDPKLMDRTKLEAMIKEMNKNIDQAKKESKAERQPSGFNNKFPPIQQKEKSATPTKSDTLKTYQKPRYVRKVININLANQEELESLPGIGPVFARRIIEYRQNNGAFQSINDLLKVKGINQGTIDKFKDRVIIKE